MLNSSRKAVSPVIAIVLLLMMTVAAAGAAYFWITSMQSSIQESSYKSIENIMEASGRRVVAQATLCKPTYPYKGLVGYWMMDEGEGNYANDSSGNGRDLNVSEAKWIDGKIGKALNFNGTSSQTSDNLVESGSLSLSLWYRIYNTSFPDGHYHILCHHRGWWKGNTFLFEITGYKDEYRVRVDGGDLVNWFGGSLQKGWDNYVVVLEEGEPFKFYRNGELYWQSGASLQGDKDWLDGEKWDLAQGNVSADEVRVYSRALSENEIKELYEAENHSARRRIDVTVRNIGSEEIPKATWVANLKHDGTNVETDAYNASSIDTGELSTLKFYFKDFKPNTKYTVELQGTGTSTTVSC